MISPDGLVLTNNHVARAAHADQAARQWRHRHLRAVLGDDPDTDLALLRVNGPRGAGASGSGNSKALAAGNLWSRSATPGL